MSERFITLEGVHPYFPGLGRVALRLRVLEEVPGERINSVVDVPLDVFRRPGAWVALTTEFRLEGLYKKADEQALLGLMWDLTGEPMHPSHGRRPAAGWALVDGRLKNGCVEVWRRADEVRTSVDERAVRLREDSPNRPDARNRAA